MCNKNCFYLTLGYFLRAPDNSNFFRFPLRVRVIWSRLYYNMDANLSAESERVRYSLIQLMWGCAAGQGILFFHSSVLNSI